MGNHPDDRTQPEVISGEAVRAVWLWADAEMGPARSMEDERQGVATQSEGANRARVRVGG
jgi:hypothetical protein